MSIQEKIDRFNVLQKKSNLEEKEKQEDVDGGEPQGV